MPKDRRVNFSSFDRATVSPYSCSSKVSDRSNCDSSSTHAGNEKEWEEARCPICMEHPHNAVLLLCSSRDKGCRPFICDTSYRHSNCLDQFRKSAAASEEEQTSLVCPLCRGLITGWDVIQPARRYMNAKTRSCSLETCSFGGNYTELRKHARLEHPSERPSEASPIRQSDWTRLEQQREIEDALAHQSDIEYDWDGWPSWDEWVDDDLWSDGSFFDFPSGMSDIEDELVDEMFSGLSLSFFSLYSSSPEEEMMDSGTSRSSDRHQRAGISANNSGSRSNTQVGDPLPNSRSRSSYRSEHDANISRSRSRYTTSSSGYDREYGQAGLRTRSSHHRETHSTRSSYRQENTPASSRTRSSYHREYDLPSPRARSRYYYPSREDAPRGRGSDARQSRQPHSGFGRRED